MFWACCRDAVSRNYNVARISRFICTSIAKRGSAWASQDREMNLMKIAVQGCCHGELDNIYQGISDLERINRYKVDMLLICGDFQAVRNYNDLQCMSRPNWHKTLGDFHKYYSGKKKAPVLTVVIGGNHEASSYFQELYHGGWVAPNIYFLGHAGCINVNGLRIAGASGIFKQHDYHKGQDERLPFTYSNIKSIYHLREYNARRLSLLSPRPDIFLSHDWPLQIGQHGDMGELLRSKPQFAMKIAEDTFGSPPLLGLMRTLRPKRWFAAHMHVRFEATVRHSEESQEFEDGVKRAEDIHADESKPGHDDMEVFAPASPPLSLTGEETQFLALDKCLREREFLEIFDILLPSGQQASPQKIRFDPEWLAITRAFHPLLTTDAPIQTPLPLEAEAREMVAKARTWIDEKIGDRLDVDNVQEFVKTAPAAAGEDKNVKYKEIDQSPWYPNPQTRAFCEMIGIADNVGAPEG